MSDALVQALLMGQRRRQDPVERQRAFADAIIKQGSDTSPVRSPMEGLARALQGGLGGFMAGRADEQQKEKSAKGVEALTAAMNAKSPEERALAMKGLDPDNEYTAPMLGQMLTQQVADERAQQRLQQGGQQLMAGYGATPQGGMGNAAKAITSIESGGRYDAVGPVANQQGHRAYGKYQVLEPNIGPWTQEVLGKPMSPQEFVANPQAQDAVFQAKFGQYVQKHGSPEAASRAWFAGEGGMNNPNARDVLGTTVQGYGQKFAQAYGPGATGAPPVAQGSADGSGTPMQQPAPQVPPVPEVQRPQPSPQQLAKHQQILQQGGYGQGPEAVAKARAAIEQELDRDWQVQRERANMGYQQQYGEYKDTRNRSAEQQEFDRRQALQNQEHDRREQTKPPDATQALSSNFADRMTNSAAIINQFANEGTSKAARMLDSKVLGVGVPFANSMQSEGYQRFRQARDDFINSQLRRESGAVISDQEYENADRQYFPQPGDTPAVMKQKELNRQLAVDGMVRNAGPSYRPSPNVPQPAQQQAPQQGGAPVKIASDADYDALPSGATFVAPDGSTRRKP